MMGNTALYFILIIIANNFHRIYNEAIPELEGNLFHEINKDLQTAANKLFSSLGIAKNFTAITKRQLLLSLHDTLKNVSENSFKIYKHIYNVSKVGADKSKGIFNLTGVFEDLLREIHLFANGSQVTGVFNTVMHVYSSSVEHTSLNKPIGCLKDVLNEINKMTLADFKSLINKPVDKRNVTMSRRFAKREMRHRRCNLKFWRPSNSSEHVLWNSTESRRVFHGKRTSARRFPFVASVHVMQEFVCAGSIIGQDLVLTAATCLLAVYYNPHILDNSNGLCVRLGSDYTQRFGESVPAVTVHFHPEFDPAMLSHNLAIIVLQRRLAFKPGTMIRRISYETQGLLPDGEVVTMLGWGDKDIQESSAFEPLAYAHLQVYNLEECKEIYTKNFVTDQHFCAGFATHGGGACRRDVGGPVVRGNALAGVVSFGPPQCGAPGAPTVFTRLAFYTVWIHSIVRKQSYASRQTTTAKSSSTTQAANNLRSPKNETILRTLYPEALQVNIYLSNILRQLLREFMKADNITQEDFLYGNLDLNEENVWTTTKKVNLFHHPLYKNTYVSVDKERQKENVGKKGRKEEENQESEQVSAENLEEMDMGENAEEIKMLYDLSFDEPKDTDGTTIKYIEKQNGPPINDKIENHHITEKKYFTVPINIYKDNESGKSESVNYEIENLSIEDFTKSDEGLSIEYKVTAPPVDIPLKRKRQKLKNKFQNNVRISIRNEDSQTTSERGADLINDEISSMLQHNLKRIGQQHEYQVKNNGNRKPVVKDKNKYNNFDDNFMKIKATTVFYKRPIVAYSNNDVKKTTTKMSNNHEEASNFEGSHEHSENNILDYVNVS